MKELRAYAARIRKLGIMPELVARIAAPNLKKAINAQLSAGLDPSGKAWAPKKDGSRALVNAHEAVTVTAFGPKIRVELEGPEVFHNKGTKRVQQRRILPKRGELPAHYVNVLENAAGEAFDRIMRGAA